VSDRLWRVLPKKWQRKTLCYPCFGEVTGLDTPARAAPTVGRTRTRPPKTKRGNLRKYLR
jgi:hypothetical protein